LGDAACWSTLSWQSAARSPDTERLGETGVCAVSLVAVGVVVLAGGASVVVGSVLTVGFFEPQAASAPAASSMTIVNRFMENPRFLVPG
jgi:hypothetical protein